ncbi:MAG TPA: AmmeMemoRadiSam system protein A [Candidatus Xenobia bacterium]|nr:AmmeMemoRadiSam system protein A [Candidatus Xenobia bacterium]
MQPLNEDEQRCLLNLARRAIRAGLRGERLDLSGVAAQLPSSRLREPGAAFVSLHLKGHLRGCVGYIVARKPLYETVVEAACAAAFNDLRFPPLREDELDGLEIEISVLSPLFVVKPEEVHPGEHGLMVSLGPRRGLLLPQVATEYGWTRERFLEETCRKAGLEADAWKKGARLEAFTAFVFSEATATAKAEAPGASTG